jgi:hypothetical protein
MRRLSLRRLRVRLARLRRLWLRRLRLLLVMGTLPHLLKRTHLIQILSIIKAPASGLTGAQPC